jgi:thiol-disulfide isomerase/thioredoxin
MLRHFRLLIGLLISGLSFQAFAEPMATDFDLPLVSSTGTVDLKGLRGHVVYLDFWATWCAPCRKSFPWMDQMHERYKDKGLSIVAVSVDKKVTQIKKFIATLQPEFIIAHDLNGDTAKAYQLRGMPTSYLIDREGRIVQVHTGFRRKDQDRREEEIRELLEH